MIPQKQDATHAAVDEVDLIELFNEVRKHTKTISISGLIGLALAGFYGFFIAKPEYISSALLLPTQTSNSDQMNAAAALLGKKSNYSDVELYQSLLTSRTVMQKLIKSKIANDADSAKGRSEPIYKILGLDTAKHDLLESTLLNLSKSITVGAKENGDGGIIEIKFSAGTPWLAKGIGSKVLEVGHEELQRVRLERTTTILSSLSGAVTQAKHEWDSSARALAHYKDQNRSISLPEQIFEISQLEMEKSAKESKYLQARKEYETLILESAKAAAPMIILDSANMPYKKNKPNRRNLLIIGFISGIIFSSIYFCFKHIFKIS